MTKLDDILWEGGRFSRALSIEIKSQIKNLMLEIIGTDESDHLVDGYIPNCGEALADIRDKVNEL